MGIRRKISVGQGGPSKDAELVDVQKGDEQWSQYLLGDGSVVRLKPVVFEVWRVENEYDADGNPLYIVRSRNVLAVTSPDGLRKSEP